jgi:hypothetical protein
MVGRGLGSAIGWARGFVTVHPWFKVFSFLLATGLWLWVQGEQVIDGLVDVEVQYRWPGHLVLTSDPPSTIEAVIRGTRSEVQRARNGSVVMFIDMREANPGVQTLAFVDQDIQGISESVKVVNLRQRDFEVVLENRLDKLVRVEVDTIGEPMRDFHVENISLSPESIWIEGPASLVEDIESVRTVGVPLSGQQETFSVEVDVALQSKHLRRRDETLVLVTVQLAESWGTKRFDGVILRAPVGWQTETLTVDVLLTGLISALEPTETKSLLIAGVVPEDMPQVKLKVRTETFELVHGGSETLRVKDIIPEEVVFEPISLSNPDMAGNGMDEPSRTPEPETP